MSLRTLKAKLKSLGLQRRSNAVDMDVLRDSIQQELDGPGNSAGYRSVWHTLKLEGMQVSRDCPTYSKRIGSRRCNRKTSKNSKTKNI